MYKRQVLSRVALAINENSGVAPRIDPAWRDYFTEHASRHWTAEAVEPGEPVEPSEAVEPGEAVEPSEASASGGLTR